MNPSRVVFVCAHGNAKSLIASRWFERLAAQRGLAVQAVARGLTPENPVPPPIVANLGREGFDVASHEASALAPADLEGASRVVLIGVEPPAWLEAGGVRVDAWDGVPPASQGYEPSRAAIRSRIEELLRALIPRGADR